MIKLGQKDFQNFEKRYRGNFFNSLTGFKSLNLIGTIDQKKQTNLAIFNSVFHIGANPAYVGFISRPNSVPRHTLENIKETSFYTVNHVNELIYKQAHQTSARYPKEDCEFEMTGLGLEFKDDFCAPFVKESNIQLGVRLIKTINIPENKTIMVMGEIVDVYLNDNFLCEDGHVNIEKAGTICGSGLDHYHKTQKIARLSYAKPNLNAEKI